MSVQVLSEYAIVTFYAQFVSQGETSLPPDIVSVIFTAHYVSFKGAN